MLIQCHLKYFKEIDLMFYEIIYENICSRLVFSCYVSFNCSRKIIYVNFIHFWNVNIYSMISVMIN